MYGLLVKCLQPPTAVSSALSGHFTSSDQPPQVLLNRENSIQIWEAVQGPDLAPTKQFGLNEYVQELVRVRVPTQELDAVLIFTSDDNVTLTQWDGERYGPVVGDVTPAWVSLKASGGHEKEESGHPREDISLLSRGFVWDLFVDVGDVGVALSLLDLNMGISVEWKGMLSFDVGVWMGCSFRQLLWDWLESVVSVEVRGNGCVEIGSGSKWMKGNVSFLWMRWLWCFAGAVWIRKLGFVRLF